MEGFVRLVEAVDDLSLDVPRASAMASRFLLSAKSQGLISADFFASAEDSSL